MKTRYLLVGISVLCLIVPLVQADDITFTVDQKEYYFLTGQQAVIPMTVNNTYGIIIQGNMKYTITQEFYQNGFTQTSTNSNSQSLSIQAGNNTMNINFGSTDQPLTLTASIEFLFEEDGQRSVSLDDIIIHFVSNQSQMNNQQNKQTSSSEEIVDAQPQNNQQPKQQTPQQKLQNNQLSQDSSALKEQIQNQIKEQEQQDQAFQENLRNNPAFQEHHQDLLNQGYNLTGKQFDSLSNDTGSFNYTYQNQNGQQATLQGKMQEGEITEIQQQTAEDRQEMLENLNNSKQFQEFQQQLQSEGYNQTDRSFQQQGNKTSLDITYKNKDNETAVIHAEFENNKLTSVELKKEDPFPFALLILPFIIIGFFLFIWLYMKKRKQQRHNKESRPIIPPKPFDYKAEAKRLLEQAKNYYQHKRYKDAYGTAGQALRLYLRYEYGLNRELTNDEVLRYLRTQKKPYQDIKQCFSLCSLVEFAKYHANNHDFQEIITTVGKTIKY